MFRLTGSFHFETSPKGRFCPSGYIIHIGFIPFTDFTFFNQIPYPSVIQGEGTPCFSGYCAHRPYARCLRPVCSVFTIRMLGVHDPYARCSPHVCPVLGRHLHRDRKSTTALHPVSPVNKAVKQKGEADGRGRKYTEETFL